MSAHIKLWLRQGTLLVVLWTAICAWAQMAQIASQIEILRPTQQHLLQALMASRLERDGARLFTDEEIRSARATVSSTATPLSRVEVEQLSLRIHKVFGPHGYYPYRIVSDDPVFPVCPGCDSGLGKTCHDPSSQSRRVIASKLLTQHPHLSEAVGSLYLMLAGGPPQLIGTIFVMQGRIVTNVHVLFDATQPSKPGDVRRLKPEHRLEAVFGGDGVRRVTLPEDSPWQRHPNLDLIMTAWPAGTVAPTGLTLASDPPSANTLVALLGFPSINNNTDRTEDIDRVFGRCTGTKDSERPMVISMGRITDVSGAALEHDANTMGNSSGSPLIRITDGTLVGVQRSDSSSSNRNVAVVASVLADLMTAAAP